MKRRDTGVRARPTSAFCARRLAGTMPSAAVIAAVLAAAALAGCAAPAATARDSRAISTAAPTASATQRATPPVSRAPSPRPSPPPVPRPRPRTKPGALPVGPPDAGALPQTRALPSTGDAAFRNVIHDFWLAVTTGNPDYARPAFFPEQAYEQVKAIADPNDDWLNRLWYDFALDVAAVRPLVGEHARLLRIEVPGRYALWVPADACYNNVGYWHVPGARVVYEQGGATRSFGIASFISWRGDWYLIHFGALNRGAAVGVVDDPEPGPGLPGPPGGC